jgi:hypothetical protein
MSGDDLCEHVAKVGLRIEPVHLAGLDQRGGDGPMLAAAVGRGLIVPGFWRAKSWSGIRFIH